MRVVTEELADRVCIRRTAEDFLFQLDVGGRLAQDIAHSAGDAILITGAAMTLKRKAQANVRCTKSRVDPASCWERARYSHSIVAGGLLEMSYATRLMPRTSLMMRLDTFASSSCGSGAQSAVMKSVVWTARRATTYS